MLGHYVMSLFDREATTKQLVARWIVTAVVCSALALIAVTLVQMCILAPERMALIGGCVLFGIAFIWGMVNS